ncbi:hypothetical protein D6T63_15910 [Arthrobacter cheniae]|uniref:Uncharacterized protein n=1 Tax=Arthrobacter cheniae TaxID=1258888 RepID=A0A3A5LY75_9MICC|nr:hypothetical protein D6T63_15910 [Arthrobacter cheniae]
MKVCQEVLDDDNLLTSTVGLAGTQRALCCLAVQCPEYFPAVVLLDDECLRGWERAECFRDVHGEIVEFDVDDGQCPRVHEDPAEVPDPG